MIKIWMFVIHKLKSSKMFFLTYIQIAFLIRLQVGAFDNTFLDLWASRDVWPVGWQMISKEIPPPPADVKVRCPKCHWISFVNVLQLQIIIIFWLDEVYMLEFWELRLVSCVWSPRESKRGSILNIQKHRLDIVVECS